MCQFFYLPGFHLGFLSRGGKRDNSRVKAKTIVCFPSVKKDVVLINFITLGGSGGMLPQENFLMFQPLRLFLVASEHSDGEYLSTISTGSLYFKSNVARMWDVPLTARSFS